MSLNVGQLLSIEPLFLSLRQVMPVVPSDRNRTAQPDRQIQRAKARKSGKVIVTAQRRSERQEDWTDDRIVLSGDALQVMGVSSRPSFIG